MGIGKWWLARRGKQVMLQLIDKQSPGCLIPDCRDIPFPAGVCALAVPYCHAPFSSAHWGITNIADGSDHLQ